MSVRFFAVRLLTDIFNREDRQLYLTKYEEMYYNSFFVTKHDVLHFSVKYIKNGILDVLRVETKEVIDNIINSYVIKDNDFAFMENCDIVKSGIVGNLLV